MVNTYLFVEAIMKLFISYASDDTSRVEELAQILRNGGHDIWFDYQPLPGQDLQEEQRNAIQACDMVISVITQQSIKSIRFWDEFNQAVKHKKSIMAVSLDKQAKIPTWLSYYPHVDFSSPSTSSSVTRLLDNIRRADGDKTESGVPKGNRRGQMLRRTKSQWTAIITVMIVVLLGLQVFNTLSTESVESKARRIHTQGMNSYDNGRFSEAIRFYDEALELDPNFTLAYYSRGKIYRALGCSRLKTHQDMVDCSWYI
jgi:tetratricopeptide (TPR) repeat protein